MIAYSQQNVIIRKFKRRIVFLGSRNRANRRNCWKYLWHRK